MRPNNSVGSPSYLHGEMSEKKAQDSHHVIFPVFFAQKVPPQFQLLLTVFTENSAQVTRTKSQFSPYKTKTQSLQKIPQNQYEKALELHLIKVCMFFINMRIMISLTLQRPIFPSYRNQLVDLQSNSTDWFLYDGNIGR